MKDNVHINETDLYSFRDNKMNPEERIAFLEHIGSCTFCSDQFAAFMSDDLITAPIDLKPNILKEVRRKQRIQGYKGTVQEASKRMQLFLYSLKVGAATSLALILLLLTVSWSDMTLNTDNYNDTEIVEVTQKINAPITTIIRDGMDAICSDIIDFSNNIIQLDTNK